MNPPVVVHHEPMPKYTKLLCQRDLDMFTNTFNIWATSKNLTDQQKKLQFQLAIDNRIAQQWFTINQDNIQNNAVTWDAFIKSFMTTCPTENNDDVLSFSEIIAMTQGRTEKATIFIQKIRYLFGQEWGKYPEKDIVLGMVKQLSINTRRYIECRGLPDTYVELMKLIQQYEAKGGTKELDDIIIKQETAVQWAATTSESQETIDAKNISDSLHKISAFTARENEKSSYTAAASTNPFISDQPFNPHTNTFATGNPNHRHHSPLGRGVNSIQAQGRNRDFRNIPKCWTCGKTGHVQATCYYNNSQQQQQWSGYNGQHYQTENKSGPQQQWLAIKDTQVTQIIRETTVGGDSKETRRRRKYSIEKESNNYKIHNRRPGHSRRPNW